MKTYCFSCGKHCNGPRFPAWSLDGKVWIGPDCLKETQAAGSMGHQNERTGMVTWASVELMGVHAQAMAEEAEKLDEGDEA